MPYEISGEGNGAGEIGIAVIKEEWGHGIGSLLLRILIRKAKSAGYPFLQLKVIQDNTRALHLYLKSGFTVLNETTLPQKTLWMILDRAGGVD